MKTKSKALLLTLCAVLLVAASVLGTMAYLTSTAKVENTFTIGKVEIKLDEAKVNANGIPEEGAARVTRNSYKLMPGTTYTKDPTVTVLEGSEESYVRMKVTFNNAKAIIDLCTIPEWADEDPTGVEQAYPLLQMVNFVELNSLKWSIVPESMVEAEEILGSDKYFKYDPATDTLTYYFYYNETVKAPDGDVVLPVLFDSIKVPEWVTGEKLNALDNFQITVVAEAIQAGSFANADKAWAAFAEQP